MSSRSLHPAHPGTPGRHHLSSNERLLLLYLAASGYGRGSSFICHVLQQRPASFLREREAHKYSPGFAGCFFMGCPQVAAMQLQQVQRQPIRAHRPNHWSDDGFVCPRCSIHVSFSSSLPFGWSQTMKGKFIALPGKRGRLTEQIEVISTSPKQLLRPGEEVPTGIVGLSDNQ